MKRTITHKPWNLAGLGFTLFFTCLVVFKVLQPGGLTQFAGFGEHFEHRYIPLIHEMGAYIKPDSGGYDGQFYAQIATDPTLQNPEFQEAIDEPAYRSRRILLPAIAHLLAFGNEPLSILIYCAINILLWYVFAFTIWNWLAVSNAKDFAKWLACVFSMGVIDSVKYSLTDLPSMLMILWMIKLASQRRFSVAGGFMASVFLKETNLLAMAAIPKLEGNIKTWIRPLLFWAATSILTLALFYGWYRFINTRFDPFHGVSGNFDWPLLSMIRNGRAAIFQIFSGNWDDRYVFRLLATVGFLIQFVYLTTRIRDFRDPLIRLGLAYAFLFIFLGDLVWWGYWAVCRVVLPMTIVFNLTFTTKKSKCYWIIWTLANLTIIHAIYRFL